MRVARIAERGKLDAIFLAISDRIDYRPFNALEPTVVLSAVAAATRHVGLVATASTTYNEPYNLARRFASLALARRNGLTVRQLLRALGGGVGHRIVVGTPEAIADDIEAWFRAGAADGFNPMEDVLPDGLETFVDAVVPILQRRGLFRWDYAGSTLRDHLGLSRPASRYAATGRSLSA